MGTYLYGNVNYSACIIIITKKCLISLSKSCLLNFTHLKKKGEMSLKDKHAISQPTNTRTKQLVSE